MFRGIWVYLIVIHMAMGAAPQQAWASKKKAAACKSKAGKAKGGKAKGNKDCKKQEKADQKSQEGAKQSGSDGMGSMIPALIGGALAGGLAAMMMAKSALDDADKKAKEAEERLKAELNKKFAEAEKKQKDSLNQGGPPNLGPAVNRVNPALAPDKAIAERAAPDEAVAERPAAVGEGANAESTGQVSDPRHKTAAAGTIEMPSDTAEVSRAYAAQDFNLLPEDATKTAAVIRYTVKVEMLDVTRELIIDLIAKGQVQEAARQIAQLEVAANVKLVELGHELRPILNNKLAQLGMPADELGLTLLGN